LARHKKGLAVEGDHARNKGREIYRQEVGTTGRYASSKKKKCKGTKKNHGDLGVKWKALTSSMECVRP